ncbi:MAG: orotate phosphoribosyltransferase [bacterium]
MSDQIDPRRAIARAILTRGAIKVSPEKPFRWASGYAMPVYIDNRCLIGYPEVRAAIAEAFATQITESGVKYDAIAGVATGAIPHATTLADKLGLPLLYIRAKAKDHGAGRQVEGDIPGGLAGKNVLVIEDTISTGGSALNAVEAMRREGATVSTCSVIYYYDFPNQENKFSAMTPSCTMTSLINFPYLLETARAENLLDETILTELETWYQNPFAWGEAHGSPRVTE